MLSTLTLGGVGLGLYGIFTKRGIKHIGENFGLLDQVVFEGSFDRALKNPLQTAKKLTNQILKNTGDFLKNTAKSISSKVSAGIANGKKAFQTKVLKPITSAICGEKWYKNSWSESSTSPENN